MKTGTAPQPELEPAGATPMGVLLLAFLIGLVFAVLGFKSAWSDYQLIDKMTHLDRFTETDGKFLQVKVREDSLASGDFYPDVLYEYSVAGKSIWGWRLSFEDEPRPKGYWEERLAAYRKGAPVKVYYNGMLPVESILEKKHDGLYRLGLRSAMGIGFLLVGLVLALLPLYGWMRKGSRS